MARRYLHLLPLLALVLTLSLQAAVGHASAAKLTAQSTQWQEAFCSGLLQFAADTGRISDQLESVTPAVSGLSRGESLIQTALLYDEWGASAGTLLDALTAVSPPKKRIDARLYADFTLKLEDFRTKTLDASTVFREMAPWVEDQPRSTWEPPLLKALNRQQRAIDRLQRIGGILGTIASLSSEASCKSIR